MLFTQLLADHQVSKFPPRELRWILQSTQQEQNIDAADIDQHDAEMTDVEFPLNKTELLILTLQKKPAQIKTTLAWMVNNHQGER